MEESAPENIWANEPVFLPPGDDGGFDTCVSRELAAPKAGELRALLATFLESQIGTVHATAGVVRLLAPDGHTLQIISSAGLSAELQDEAENFVELDCEAFDSSTFGRVVRTSDVSQCAARQNCRYATCRSQSLVAAPLESPNQPGVPLGILTLFFDAPRTAANKVMNSVAAFAEMMGAAIEYTRINRESYRASRLAARRDIANDIHDSLAQALTFARMRTSLVIETIKTGKAEAGLKYAEDIDEALEIAQKSARELGVETKRLTDGALKYLSGLEFQGNVRQLENLCHWLTVMAPGQQVDVGDLPAELREASSVVLATDWESALEGEVDRMLARGVPDVHGVLAQTFERILISRALAHTGGRRIEAAQALGIGRNTITRKIAELGIDGGKEHAAE